MPSPLSSEVVAQIVAFAADGKITAEIESLTQVSRWTINRRLLCIELCGKPYLPRGKTGRNRILTAYQEQV